MRKLPLLLLILVFSTAGAAVAENATCWSCGVDDGEPDCVEDTSPNFAMDACEERCFFILNSSVCRCRTFGTVCAITPPSERIPGPPSLVVDERLVQQIRDQFDLEIGELLSFDVGPKHEGQVSGLISIAERGGEERAEIYRFKGEIHLGDRFTRQSFVFQEHPSIETVTAELRNDGREAFITVRYRSGEERSEFLSLD